MFKTILIHYKLVFSIIGYNIIWTKQIIKEVLFIVRNIVIQ